MASKKMTDIPVENGVSQELDNFETWVIANSKKILFACAGIVVIVAIVSAIWIWADGAEGRNRKAFASASTQEQIEAALVQHPSGPAASQAKIRLAKMLAEKKDYAGAAKRLEEAAADQDIADFVRARAQISAAGNYELAGKPEDAIRLFSAVANNPAFDESSRVEAAYGQGRLLAAKKDVANARLAFKRAIVKNPTSKATAMWSSLASRALDRLPAAPEK